MGQKLIIYYLQYNHFKYNGSNRLKIKGYKKIRDTNTKHKKTATIILRSK